MISEMSFIVSDCLLSDEYGSKPSGMYGAVELRSGVTQ